MSSGTDALYGFAADDPRRHSPQAIALQSRALPQSVLAHTALAFIATTCLWTVYSHVTVPEVATLAERFAALPAATAIPTTAKATVPKPIVQKNYAALLDARQMHITTGTLTRGTPSRLADHLAAATSPGILKSQEKFPASQPSVQLATLNVPMPPPRPAALAALQNPAAPSSAVAAPKVIVEDKATVLALISSNKNSLFNKLFGKSRPEGPTLAYASADGGIASDARSTILFDGMPKYDQWTAVYDISARKVYMPDGTELEAHSGLGTRMDDPRNVHVKMHGATPPHVYDLTPREALFHGVEALRLTPVGGQGRIFGRTGLLAHTYMLGPRGDSNGCVSFKNYAAFLQAYKKGLVKRMVVVAKLA
jgi:hypothetical protein